MYPVQDMIQNGQFGYTSPQPYNPYMNQQTFYNNITPFNQPSNNFVYAPINNNSYSYYQNQRYNYYDPYGSGSYSNAGVYQQFNSPASYQVMMNEQIALDKIKQRLVANYFHTTFDEEKYDENIRKQFNPPTKSYSIEEIRDQAEFANAFKVADACNNNKGLINPVDISAYYHACYVQSVHDNFDNHSLAQFLYCDIPRIKKHDWIKENVNIDKLNKEINELKYTKNKLKIQSHNIKIKDESTNKLRKIIENLKKQNKVLEEKNKELIKRLEIREKTGKVNKMLLGKERRHRKFENLYKINIESFIVKRKISK